MTKDILIVEDGETKFSELSSFIQSQYSVTMRRNSSIDDVFLTLPLRKWDLMILDMTFQISRGEGKETEKQQLAGVEIMRFMLASKLNIPVIIFTQHTHFSGEDRFNIKSVEELESLSSQAFPLFFKGVVKYSALNDDWKASLLTLLKEVWA